MRFSDDSFTRDGVKGQTKPLLPLKEKRSTPGLARAVVIVTRRGNISFVSHSAVSWLKDLGLTPATLLEKFLSAQSATPFCLGANGRRLWVTEAGTNRKGSICLILETLPAPLHSLTPREREAHHWVWCGKSNDEFATQMGIKASTVRKHLQRVNDKLGVDNRTAAASYGALLALAAVPD